ncbi:uncharacterized protein [Hyperolius riggenbachi]|uniref:uncharacterized protein n=1 Tax=Hyperolius riggenbachi TaxID=752182 RepID=UPI0035A29431
MEHPLRELLLRAQAPDGEQIIRALLAALPPLPGTSAGTPAQINSAPSAVPVSQPLSVSGMAAQPGAPLSLPPAVGTAQHRAPEGSVSSGFSSWPLVFQPPLMSSLSGPLDVAMESGSQRQAAGIVQDGGGLAPISAQLQVSAGGSGGPGAVSRLGPAEPEVRHLPALCTSGSNLPVPAAEGSRGRSLRQAKRKSRPYTPPPERSLRPAQQARKKGQPSKGPGAQSAQKKGSMPAGPSPQLPAGCFPAQPALNVRSVEMQQEDGAAQREPLLVNQQAQQVPERGDQMPGRQRVTVWLCGHSFVYWAGRRALIRPYGEHLDLSGFSIQVMWKGVRGLQWKGLVPMIKEALCVEPPPEVLIVHLGGNDVGKIRTLQLIFDIKSDFSTLRELLPGTVLVFSEIISRLCWLRSPELSYLEKIRKKINRRVSKFMVTIQGFAYRHHELEGGIVGLYRTDGVHLSEIGSDILNMNLQEMIEQAVGLGGARL